MVNDLTASYTEPSGTRLQCLSIFLIFILRYLVQNGANRHRFQGCYLIRMHELLVHFSIMKRSSDNVLSCDGHYTLHGPLRTPAPRVAIATGAYPYTSIVFFRFAFTVIFS